MLLAAMTSLRLNTPGLNTMHFFYTSLIAVTVILQQHKLNVMFENCVYISYAIPMPDNFNL